MNWKNILAELKAYPVGVWEEAHKVDWPSRDETLKLSLATGLVVAVAAIFVAGVDFVFSNLIRFILSL